MVPTTNCCVKTSKCQASKYPAGTAYPQPRLGELSVVSCQKDTTSKPPRNHGWDAPLHDSVDRFPEPLKRILASNLAERLRDQLNDPDILLAVQEIGQWLAEYLADWLSGKPRIILVEKDISPDRAREYLEIPVKGVKERPNLFIDHKELDQNSGNMVIVDDFIDSGGTVRSIVERLKTRNKNVKAVATIAVTKTNLDKLQEYLRNNKVELAYLLTAEGGLP